MAPLTNIVGASVDSRLRGNDGLSIAGTGIFKLDAVLVANNPGKRQDPPSIDEDISRGPWGRTRQAQHRS
jgi:hypothetical protein